MFVHLNGRLVPAAEACISVWDGGYLYGDGIYTTLRLYNGRPLDLAAHLARLRTMATALELPCQLEFATVRAAITDLVAANDLSGQDGRLRVTVSRGGGQDTGMPLRDLDSVLPTTLLTLVPIAPELAGWARNGIPVIILDEVYARGNFPNLKTLNSLATLQALRRATAAGCPEAILTGPGGRLLEGSVSNLFLVRKGELCTPIPEGEFLAGRTRERILNLTARDGATLRQVPLVANDLLDAEEAFVASSVREILPVVEVDGHRLGSGVPGEITRHLQQAYHDLIRNELDAPDRSRSDPAPG